MNNYSTITRWVLTLTLCANLSLLYGQDAINSTHSQKTGSAIAGAQYAKSNLKQTIFGKHYRSTWTTEIHNIP